MENLFFLSRLMIHKAFRRFRLSSVVLGLTVFVGCGCGRKVYVPVERVEVRYDSLLSVRESMDSILVRDSVIIEVRGDSVLERRVSERTRVALRHDTVVRRLADTVRVEVPVPVSDLPKAGSERRRTSRLQVALFVAALGALLFMWRRRERRPPDQ